MKRLLRGHTRLVWVVLLCALLLLPGAKVAAQDGPTFRPLATATNGPNADAVYGQPGFGTGAVNDGQSVATPTGLNGPQGVAGDGAGGLYTADTGNNRVLHFPAGSAEADRVYGQPNYISAATVSASASRLNAPGGIAIGGGGVYVADTGNNRVLFFPANSTTASRVYGQPDFSTTTPGIGASALNAPSRVAAAANGDLYVSDTDNNRVLFFPANSTTASRVYGQPDFVSRVTNLGATGLNGPQGIAVDKNGGLYVADTLNFRVLFFPAASHSATRVYGQPGFDSRISSAGDSGLNGPKDVTVDTAGGLYIADTGNSRITFYASGTAAVQVLGQPDFGATAPHPTPTANTLTFPTGVAVVGTNDLYIADTAANRALFYNFGSQTVAPPPSDSQYFPQTRQVVSGKFLTYWRNNGGLPVFGYPITAAGNAVDPETGKTFLTQWFERRRFEYHPENKPPYDILGGLIGKDLRRNALAVDPDFQPADRLFDPTQPATSQRFFGETGHNLRFGFLDYWNKNGGLDRFGFPISEEHLEVDPETGSTFVMQWFERARFEYHPENQAPYTILLGLLGNQIIKPKGGISYDYQVGRVYAGLKRPSGVATDAAGNVFVADARLHNVRKYDGGGKLLATFTGSGTRTLQTPVGVAFDPQGNLWVLDATADRVTKFDATGNAIFSFGNTATSISQFSRAQGIAIDPTGNIYIADTGLTQSIEKYDSTGALVGGWQLAGADSGIPVGIAVDAAGNVYVTDTSRARIEKYDGTGNLEMQWGGVGDMPGQFRQPTSIAVDAQGFVYVGDSATSRVQKFDGTGAFVGAWGGFGNTPGTLSDPAGLALDRAGNIYVADRGHAQIAKFGGNFAFIAAWGSRSVGNGGLYAPQGIATGAAGNIYIADSGTNRILQYDATGKFIGAWGGYGNAAGQFNQPSGVATDSTGNVYVADTGNHRIQKFDSTGTFLLTWAVPDLVQTSAITVDRSGTAYVAVSGRESAAIRTYDSIGTPLGTIGNPVLQIAVGLATDGAGNLYVTDTANRVLKLGTGGQLLAVFGAGVLNGPRGVAVDAVGNVYVADTGNNRIVKLDGAGNVSAAVGGSGLADGQLYQPTAIALDAQNTLLVTDTGNDRLVAFRQQ